MNLTIQTLFTDPQIVKAVIDRVLQMRLEAVRRFLGNQDSCFQDLFGNGYWRCCRFYYWQE